MKKVRFSSGDNSDNEGGNDEVYAFDSVSGVATIHLDPKNEPTNEGNVDSDNAKEQDDDEEVVDIDESTNSLSRVESQLRKKNEHIRRLTDKVHRLEEESAQLQRSGIRINGTNGHTDDSSQHFDGFLNGEQANATIEQLKMENQIQQTTIDELRKGLSKALEAAHRTSDDSGNDDNIKKTISNYENEITKLQQKLANANEEKEYYKAQHNNNASNVYQTTMNGGFSDRDDFGKELMQANKRKYQLESKVRQLDLELRDAQNSVQHLDRNLKSTEKYLWLEKERSATLEQERNGLNGELDWLRKENDRIKEQLDLALNVGSGAEDTPESPQKSGEEAGKTGHFFDELERVKKEYDVKIADILQLKNQLEWKLGEVTKNWNDAKWRVGELESSIAHKDYELDQSSNRIKQLESVLATPVTNMSEELKHLREEVRKLTDQKSTVDWKLGEVTQWWNDAKWRIGELEGQLSHKHHQLDEAHRRISELQNQGHAEISDDFRRELESLRHDKGHLEWRVSELDKAWNDAKWRVGELEAEVRHKNDQIRHLESDGNSGNMQRILNELKDQKSTIEWRLGEITQYWNDAKWRVGELQEHLNQKEHQLKDAYAQLEANRNSSQQTSERALTQLSESFVIRKQPHGDRHRWNLVTWENINQRNGDLRRVWFDINAEGANEVFLMGSFLNWECALVCERLPDDPNRRGIWVEIPAGRHQFRFLRDGQWHTASNYPQEYNEFGGSNNWIDV
ncbi:glycogen recognition site of AMP-activated protein kinase domain-containing protein [Ditylenchus destructor]|nr:glycogen recognition site of AMP-activated protein kinase domain-containing protein [Ditylenchus destructor]